jgi:triosephosphate isomerase
MPWGKQMKIIVANWKMNKTNAEVKEFFGKFPKRTNNQVIFFAPFTAFASVIKAGFTAGAQNFHPAKNGAFTGEISLDMLAEAGVKVVLAGHSERRTQFNETDEFLYEKVKVALSSDFKVILCIGETRDEREKGKTEPVLKRQLEGISPHKNLIIAYEPVWAIGTGTTPSNEQIKQIHANIKSVVNVPLLYGGSANEKNFNEILSIPNVDGVLVGIASLTAEKFSLMVGYE